MIKYIYYDEDKRRREKERGEGKREEKRIGEESIEYYTRRYNTTHAMQDITIRFNKF